MFPLQLHFDRPFCRPGMTNYHWCTAVNGCQPNSVDFISRIKLAWVVLNLSGWLLLRYDELWFEQSTTARFKDFSPLYLRFDRSVRQEQHFPIPATTVIYSNSVLILYSMSRLKLVCVVLDLGGWLRSQTVRNSCHCFGIVLNSQPSYLCHCCHCDQVSKPGLSWTQLP